MYASGERCAGFPGAKLLRTELWLVSADFPANPALPDMRFTIFLREQTYLGNASSMHAE